MTFTVKIHPKVHKFLSKVDSSVAERIRTKLKIIKEDPFIYLEHYEGENVYKLRIGNYRALIDVNHSSKILFVQVVDHRKRIYKR